MVVGDNKPFVAALITLDVETLPQWLKRQGLDPETPVAELAKDEKVLTHVQSVVDRANESVSRAESIREFRLLNTDFTIESGHLTPSMKIKRPLVMKDFADEVETLYSDAAKNKA